MYKHYGLLFDSSDYSMLDLIEQFSCGQPKHGTNMEVVEVVKTHCVNMFG